MESVAKERGRNPRQGANPLSVIFFWWTGSFFKLAYNKNLTEENLQSTLPEDQSNKLAEKLLEQWNHQFQITNGKPSLLRAILITFRWSLLRTISIQLASSVSKLVLPFILGEMLKQFNTGGINAGVLGYAGLFAFMLGVSILSMHHHVYQSTHTGMQIRVACSSLIYRKALSLSQDAMLHTPAGKIVNLLSNDVGRFDRVLIFAHYVITTPVAAVVMAYHLSSSYGVAAAVGVSMTLAIVVIQASSGKLLTLYRRRTAEKTDLRIKFMDEIISAVQVIKMYAWEKPFSNIVTNVRREEVSTLMKFHLINCTSMALCYSGSRIGTMMAVSTMVLMGDQLNISKVFVVYSFLGMLSFPFALCFLFGLVEGSEAMVSIQRLQEVLLSEDFKAVKREESPDKNEHQASHVRLNNVTAHWRSGFVLRDVTLDAREGQLIAVIGTVGSGKSSLLQAILGELPISSGTCSVQGRVSYASQDPWLFGATVRQNIVFGSNFDKERYNNVVNVCALQQDFNQFPQGDLTLVGDRGVTLSGGQKARINLARAVYNDAEVYLLDDPLSAVDTSVGKHLYDKCINTYLKQKIRILVTHQTQLLRNADYVIILNNGKIEAQGTYDRIMTNEAACAQLLGLVSASEEQKAEDKKLQKKISQRSMLDNNEAQENTMEEKLDPETSANTGALMHYLTDGAHISIVIFSALLFILGQTATSCGDYWLTYWTTQEQRMSAFMKTTQSEADEIVFHNNESTSNNTYYLYYTAPDFLRDFDTRTSLYLYIGLVFLQILGYIAAATSLVFFLNQSSKLFHKAMFNSVIRTRMRFFTINPPGRILNRFSKDLGSVDDLLPRDLFSVVQIAFLNVGALFVISTLHYLLFIPMIVLFTLVFFACRTYLVVSDKTKRLEGITKSPVFTHVSATLQGLSTVRAYGAQQILTQEFDRLQDTHSSSWFMFISGQCMCGLIVDSLCYIYIVVLIFFIPYAGQDTFGEKTGLAMSLSLNVTSIMQVGMKKFVESSSNLVSVERIIEYTRLEEEPLLESTPDKQTPSEWPTEGCITFEDVGLKYTETGPSVLKGLTFTINPMEKVGIVGRTGAGKSSLISTLFRLAWVEGSLRIDGVDTKDISLHDLRRKISIIPQDPVLFSGSVRRNLDPFEEFSDDDLWNVLEQVELKATVHSLDEKVSKGGTNFSVGQRQLVCLARAILRNNKILVLDEATANVDPHTDFLIQNKVRERFANCTVLTIAHRLNTIMDCSKVLVIDKGHIVEFDHPYILLLNNGGHFWKMVQRTGSESANKLYLIAENNYDFTDSRL